MRMVLFLFLAAVSFSVGAGNLRGSTEARATENAAADFFGLERIADDESLSRMIRDHRLVRIPNNRFVHWHKDLPEKYAYCLPHVRSWLIASGMLFRERFGKPLTVNSAVRPKSYQEKLSARNPNAAPTEGPLASTHPTGATVDIGYKGLTRREIRWFMRLSSKRESRGEIQATKERHQACFHVMVYPSPKKIATIEKTDTTP